MLSSIHRQRHFDKWVTEDATSLLLTSAWIITVVLQSYSIASVQNMLLQGETPGASCKKTLRISYWNNPETKSSRSLSTRFCLRGLLTTLDFWSRSPFTYWPALVSVNTRESAEMLQWNSLCLMLQTGLKSAKWYSAVEQRCTNPGLGTSDSP